MFNELYHSVADRVSQGRIPYRDFPLEYPIGCLPQLVLPIVAGRDVLAYRTAYIAEMLLINALLVLVLARQVERREGPAAVPRRLAWYLLCYLFLCRLIVSRLDVVPALLAFLAAVGWFGGRPIVGGRRSRRWGPGQGGTRADRPAGGNPGALAPSADGAPRVDRLRVRLRAGDRRVGHPGRPRHAAVRPLPRGARAGDRVGGRGPAHARGAADRGYRWPRRTPSARPSCTAPGRRRPSPHRGTSSCWPWR